jgi:hypothetical protein
MERMQSSHSVEVALGNLEDEKRQVLRRSASELMRRLLSLY